MTPQMPGQAGPLDSQPVAANPLAQPYPQQPPQPSLPLTPPPEDPQQEIYTIDPLVLERPVKIRVDGASRMLSKDLVAQSFQQILPVMTNGPLISELAQSGQTVDWPVFWKMLQDGTGTSKMYPLVRPMNPQEQQQRQQPSPDAKNQMQMKQMDMQTRTQLGQQKSQTEQMKIQVQKDLEEKKISEESARHILDFLQKHNETNDPAKERESQVKLQAMQQEHALKRDQMQQEGHIKTQLALQKGQVDTHVAQQKGAVEQQLGQQKLGLQSQQNHMAMQQNHVKHQGSMMQAKALLAKGHAQATAAKMQPKKPAETMSRPTEK